MGLVVIAHRYILEGGLRHQDSAGNEGNLRDGWVQWMTAGRGVVHSEMPTGESRHSPRRKQKFSRILVDGHLLDLTVCRTKGSIDGFRSRMWMWVPGMSAELLRDGGCLEGFQLWVNLEAKDKMVPPRSVPIPDRHPPFSSASRSCSDVPHVIGTHTWRE